MIPISVRILVCTVPQDMRRSFDSLALVTQQLLGENPQSGSLYIFVDKRATRVKVLWWDRNGYCLLSKRLHRALFRIPDVEPTVGGNSIQLDAAGFSRLIAGVEKQIKHNEKQFDA